MVKVEKSCKTCASYHTCMKIIKGLLKPLTDQMDNLSDAQNDILTAISKHCMCYSKETKK